LEPATGEPTGKIVVDSGNAMPLYSVPVPLWQFPAEGRIGSPMDTVKKCCLSEEMHATFPRPTCSVRSDAYPRFSEVSAHARWPWPNWKGC